MVLYNCSKGMAQRKEENMDLDNMIKVLTIIWLSIEIIDKFLEWKER